VQIVTRELHEQISNVEILEITQYDMAQELNPSNPDEILNDVVVVRVRYQLNKALQGADGVYDMNYTFRRAWNSDEWTHAEPVPWVDPAGQLMQPM
jgi:hypothetical protein